MNDFDKYIASIYREMELYLIQSMKRNLALHIAEEAKTGIKYPQWQAMKLKELKRYQRQNKRIINKYTRGLPKEIARHMKDELDQGAMSQFKLYKEALKAGYKPARLIKDSFFKINDRAVSALIDSLQNDMSKVNTAVLRMVNDVYRETIFKSAMFVKNGVFTEKQAYDMAVKSFLEKGINCIEYKNGRRVNIADYTEMAVRTASQRAYLVGQGEFRKEIGETLIIINRHGGACELCKPFEHKVLIDDVYSGGKPEDGDYMLLSEAMNRGLYHPRCRHGCGTYYPELEEINHYETEDNRLNEYGDEKINIAHTENMIQKYKRLSMGSKSPENIAKYSEKQKYWERLKTKYSAANSAKRNTTKETYFNPEYSYEIKLEGYSDEVNSGLSKAARSVAELGSVSRKEYLNLVDLRSGRVLYSESGNQDSVGYSGLWEFLKQHPKESFAFVHNHNNDTYFSETDMRTMLTNKQLSVMIAVRNDAVIYVAERTKMGPKKVTFDSVYQAEINDINKLYKSGKITAVERNIVREETIVNNLLRDYTKGLVEFDGRK